MFLRFYILIFPTSIKMRYTNRLAWYSFQTQIFAVNSSMYFTIYHPFIVLNYYFNTVYFIRNLLILSKKKASVLNKNRKIYNINYFIHRIEQRFTCNIILGNDAFYWYIAIDFISYNIYTIIFLSTLKILKVKLTCIHEEYNLWKQLNQWK